MPILDAARKFLSAVKTWQQGRHSSKSNRAETFLEELFQSFPFSPQAKRWLQQHVRVQVVDFHSIAGGGGWYPDRQLVQLNSAQYEAAIHELAHAVWHEQRRDRIVRDGLVSAVQRLAQDDDPRWGRVRTLAMHYIEGIPSQPGFEQGMLLSQSEWGTGGGPQGEWNDWEIFAGLASGCMADIRLLPPYVRPYFSSLFVELPSGTLAPETVVPHK